MSSDYFKKQQSITSAVKAFEKNVRPFLDSAAREHLIAALNEDNTSGRTPEIKVKRTRQAPPDGE